MDREICQAHRCCHQCRWCRQPWQGMSNAVQFQIRRAEYPQMINRNNEPLSLSSIDFVLNINLRGTLDFVRQLLPLMTKNQPTEPDKERGCVILVSSSAAYDGQPGQVSLTIQPNLPHPHTYKRKGFLRCIQRGSAINDTSYGS